MKIRLLKTVLVSVAIIIVIVIISAIFTAEYYISQPEFCGSCHIMEKYYDTWAITRHNHVKCVDCHYAPGEQHALKSKFTGLGRFFSYFSTEEKEVRRPSKINDLSCTECHPQQSLDEDKLSFKKKVIYIHRTHFDKTIEGQNLHCDTCHQHVSADKHFEVPKEACYLCHFKNSDFNEGRGKCSLCHDIPTKPLQKQKKEYDPEEKPVTHASLEKAKVPCQSCHYELIRGEGEIKEEECLNCHDAPDTLAKAYDKKLMHQQHVVSQNARCFDCHRPIQHKEVEFLDPVKESCFICHPDHHKYQKLLLMGDKLKGVMRARGLMYDVKTNCIGCHSEERNQKGETVLHGSAATCAACHTEKHEAMVKEWKDKIKEELNYAKEIELEAEQAIEHARGKVSKEKLDMAFVMLREGQENVRIVEFGGGVHNKKYSVVLLDAAMNKFEDLIELLQ